MELYEVSNCIIHKYIQKNFSNGKVFVLLLKTCHVHINIVYKLCPVKFINLKIEIETINFSAHHPLN